MHIIYININNDNLVTAVGTSRIGENPIKVEVDSLDILDNPNGYRYIDGNLFRDESLLLEIAKQDKDAELNRACMNAILGGFEHTINGIKYWFSFDDQAQFNFQGALHVLGSGITNQIMWTVKQDGKYTRIPITKQIMDELAMAILMHKESKVGKYRDFLMPLVEDATTIEELNIIKW